MAQVVRNRSDLFATLHAAAAASTTADPRAAVRACMTAYAPPAERLIIRTVGDFAALGTTAAAVKAAADPTFWAYNDYDGVLASFALEANDKERRVMGIEGVGSKETLHKVLATGQQVLATGHLSLVMMEGKVASGEWHWIDEAGCSMHTATNKPGLLRTEVRSRLGLELKVVRHDAELAGSAEEQEVESVGDLIIFDMNFKDVTTEVGNTKVFCQNPSGFMLSGLETLLPDIGQALEQVLDRELK